MIARLDRLLGRASDAGAYLALPVALLLFLQWPLREFLRLGSREANDLGQVFFAVHVALAVTAATRAGAHLALSTLGRERPAATRRMLRRAGILVGALPWALFLLFSGRQLFWTSLAHVERFADTANPGYFIVKLAAALLAVLVVLQAIVDWRKPGDGASEAP